MVPEVPNSIGLFGALVDHVENVSDPAHPVLATVTVSVEDSVQSLALVDEAPHAVIVN